MKDSSTIPAGLPDLRGQVFHERYAISERVAASSHRITFVGTEVDGVRPIVLVLVRPSLLHDAATRERFERRVRACARVRHPAIGDPIDSGETLDGKLWLVFERPEGEPLHGVLAGLPSGRLPWAEARPLLLELVRGLAAAHARGVVHGSVSPASCWVHGRDGDAPGLRLLELGANFDPTTDEPVPSYSRTTHIGGDPMYMAPESAGGVLGDARSDAYLVGLVAWEMLVGRPPFQAVNPFQLMAMHLQAPVPAMREAGADVPAAVEAWVRGLLAKAPAERPATMKEVEQGLLALDEHGQPQAVRTEELAPSRGRRGRAQAAAARDEAAQRLGEPTPVQGLGRRLPGQEIVDPRAVIVARQPAPGAGALPVEPPPMAAVPSSSPLAEVELERTLAFVAMGHGAEASPSQGDDVSGTVMLAAPRLDPPAEASEGATGTVMLSRPQAEPRADVRPDATLQLDHAVGAGGLPEATLMLSGAELAVGGALQPSTMVLSARHEEPAPTATVALSMNATLVARASDIAELRSTMQRPAPAGPSMQAAPSPHPVGPIPAPVPYVPMAGPPMASPPMASPPTDISPAPAARSRLGPLVAILALIAAAAGIVVGLLLAGG